MNVTVNRVIKNGEVSDQKLDLQSEIERTRTYLGMLEVWTPVCDVLCSWCCAWESSTEISDWRTDRNCIKAQRRWRHTSRQVKNLMCIGPCIILITEDQNPTRCHLLLYYAYVRLNMFREPLCPSSGAHDGSVGYHSGRLVMLIFMK
jgi:hypothetical protein